MRRLAPLVVWLALPLLAGVGRAAEGCEECPGRVWFVDASSKAASPDGRSWATAFVNLRKALNTAGSGDCIWVARGRYVTSSSGNRSKAFEIERSLRLYGGFAGYETCLSQRAGFFLETRLSAELGQPGPTDNGYNVIRILGPPPPGETYDVVIDGFNIRDAYNDFAAGEGGGVQVLGVNKLRIENCFLRANQADYGAGLFAEASALDVIRTEVTGNRARKDGGGLFLVSVKSGIEPSIAATLTSVVIGNNRADRRGGGFFLADMPLGRPLLFANALFHGNSAVEGGAGYLAEADFQFLGYDDPALARVVNSTVADNAASLRGAAFVVEESGLLPAELYVENSIVWANTGALPAIAASPFGFSYVTHSLVQPGSPFACIPGPGCTSVPGCDTYACDPLFGPGYRPQPGSPAIDQGYPLLPPDTADLDGDGDRLEPVPLDLDDQPRLVGAYDRGCYEAP